MPEKTRTIVAGGGYLLGSAIDSFLLELSGPRVCFVPTARGDDASAIVRFYESFGHRAEASHAVFHPWPRPDLRKHILSRDVVYVAGGSMANMLDGAELREVVTAREGATAYRVEADGETALEARLL